MPSFSSLIKSKTTLLVLVIVAIVAALALTHHISLNAVK